jgi:hypothetical protein
LLVVAEVVALLPTKLVQVVAEAVVIVLQLLVKHLVVVRVPNHRYL